MTITVKGFEHCEDDCPFAVPCDDDEYFFATGRHRYSCEHKGLCRHLWDSGYTQGFWDKQEEIADMFITSEDKFTIKEICDKMIAKIHSRYEFGEKITDYDGYAIQLISELEKEVDENEN